MLSRPIIWAPGGGEVTTGTLAARRLGSGGRPVVLLHGLGGSQSIWGSAYDQLGEDHRLLALDLLGCGMSPHPPSGYRLVDHADAVARALRELGIEEGAEGEAQEGAQQRAQGGAIVVGHSFGSLVALALAMRHPRTVAGIVAISPPLYRDAAEAGRRTSAALTALERFLCLPTWWSRLICRNVCMRRPHLAEACARRLRAELPAVVVRESIMHTWSSYSQSIAELLEAVARPSWLAELEVPVRLLVGGLDLMPDGDLLDELAGTLPHVSLRSLPDANHLVPLTHPDACLTAVREVDAALSSAAR